MNRARHTFYISSVYKVNSLAYSTACSLPHWLVHWPYRKRAERYDPLECPISRNTRSVAFPFIK